MTYIVNLLDSEDFEVNSWSFDSRAEAEGHVEYVTSGQYDEEEDFPLDSWTRIEIVEDRA